MSSMIFFLISGSQIFGTSPEFSKLLISSKKLSFTICVSVNRKVHSCPSTPVYNFSYLMNSLKLSILYPFTISIDLFSDSNIKLHSLVKLYLPLPPTPISMAFPLGYLNTLAILSTCSIASSKKINLDVFFPSINSS